MLLLSGWMISMTKMFKKVTAYTWMQSQLDHPQVVNNWISSLLWIHQIWSGDWPKGRLRVWVHQQEIARSCIEELRPTTSAANMSRSQSTTFTDGISKQSRLIHWLLAFLYFYPFKVKMKYAPKLCNPIKAQSLVSR